MQRQNPLRLDEVDAATVTSLLTSRVFTTNLLLSALLCAAVHLLMGWGELSNWSRHKPSTVCLARWAHPAGFHAGGVAMLEEAPLDCFLTALFACLGQSPRLHDVRAGRLPHVRPDVLRSRPLMRLLFFEGCGRWPNVASLLAVGVAWGVLYGGLVLSALGALWALPVGGAPRARFCLDGWSYLALRIGYTTIEAALVTAGSFLLWCSKAESLASRTARERAELSRASEAEAARARAGAFATLQRVCLVTATVVGALGAWGALLSSGTVGTAYWAAAVGLATAAGLNGGLGLALSAHHRRDEAHAARPLRPGLLLGLHLLLALCTALGAAAVSAICFAAMPLEAQGVLQNWASLQFEVLPFNDPLIIANGTLADLRRLGIALCALAALEALLAVSAVNLLSARGLRTLLPPALGAAALTAASVSLALSSGAPASAACLASPHACAFARGCLLSSLLLLLFALAPLLAYPARSRGGFAAYMCGGGVVVVACAACAVLAAAAAAGAPAAVVASWGTIEALLAAGAYECTGDRAALFGAAAAAALNGLSALSATGAATAALLLAHAAHERRCAVRESAAFVDVARGGGDADGGGGGGDQIVVDGGGVGGASGAAGLGWWRSGRAPGGGAAKRLRFEAVDTGGLLAQPPPPQLHQPSAHAEPLLAPHATPRDSAASSWLQSPLAAAGLSPTPSRLAASPVASVPMTPSRDTESTVHFAAEPTTHLLLGNAARASRATTAAVRRLAEMAQLTPLRRLALALGALGIAWLLAMCVLDATAAATVAHVVPRDAGGATVPLELMSGLHSVCDPEASKPLILRVENRFARGRTEVRLEPHFGTNLTVRLEVSTVGGGGGLVPPDVRVCGLAPHAPCAGDAGDVEVEVVAAPPASCNERCGWWWMWYPCRCHAAATLVVNVPQLHNVSSSLGLLGLLADLEVPRRCLPAVEVKAAAGTVSVGGRLGGSQMLSSLRVEARGAKVDVEGIIVLGGNLSASVSDGGVLRLANVLAPHVAAVADSLNAQSVVAASPCLYTSGASPPTGAAACPPAPNGTEGTRVGLLLGEASLETLGGPLMLNGSVGAEKLELRAADSLVVYDLELVGQLRVRAGGVAHVSNAIALGCGACASAAAADETWLPAAGGDGDGAGGLPLGLFCIAECDADEATVEFAGEGDGGGLSAALLAAPSVRASAQGWGKLVLSESVLLPSGGGAPAAAETGPHVNLSTQFGNIALNGLIALGNVSQTLNCTLESYGGDIKALFTGAINGSYAVHAAPTGVGAVDIVVDNVPVSAHARRLGSGNASVSAINSYGDISLSLKTRAPNALAQLVGGSQHERTQAALRRLLFAEEPMGFVP